MVYIDYLIIQCIIIYPLSYIICYFYLVINRIILATSFLLWQITLHVMKDESMRFPKFSKIVSQKALIVI